MFGRIEKRTEASGGGKIALRMVEQLVWEKGKDKGKENRANKGCGGVHHFNLSNIGWKT